MESFVDTYHYYGAEFVSWLQTVLPFRGTFFMRISELGDPGLAFTFYFPLVVSLHAGLGVRLMWSIIFCEWSNMILKWVVAGDRPYWWVHETHHYAKGLPPPIHQYPITCETGPGMPSGHSKLNAAMFYVLVSAFIDMVVKKSNKLNANQRTWVIRGLWTSFVLWMILVVLSRVYIAAHFPHQCIAGVIIGILVARQVARVPALHVLSRSQYLALTLAIFTTVLGTYFGFKAMGGNVLWSLEKAVKWCIRRDYIHVDSTPFYSFSRYSGVSLGLGVGLSSSWHRRANRGRFTAKMTISLVVISLFVSQSAAFIHRSLSPNMQGFYIAEFLVNATMTYLCVAGLPNFVRWASRVPQAAEIKGKRM